MRSPSRNRSTPRQIDPPEDKNYTRLSKHVMYIGSPEHKRHPSFAGPPSPRPDASLCPPDFKDAQEQLTGWLQHAIQQKAVGSYWEGDYPRYAWYKDGETVYLARLVNRVQGQYKGFPIERSEWPDGIEECYG